jgi:hypothetical protein
MHLEHHSYPAASSQALLVMLQEAGDDSRARKGGRVETGEGVAVRQQYGRLLLKGLCPPSISQLHMQSPLLEGVGGVESAGGKQLGRELLT